MTHYRFDIDGTICETVGTDYAEAQPISEAVAALRGLKAQGHTITLFTARGTVTGVDWRAVTERQLIDWGVPYNSLVFGKPAADVYIDDRAVSAHDWQATWQLPGMADNEPT